MLKSFAKLLLRIVFRTVPAMITGSRLLQIRRSAFQVAPFRPAGFNSQKGQDWRVDDMLDGQTAGVFVDVGAFDGVTGSNSLYFERELGWTGLCVEPNPDVFESLARNREALCVRTAIARSPGSAEFVALSGPSAQLSGLACRLKQEKVDQAVAVKGSTVSKISVPVRTLKEVVEEAGIRSIDFLTIDVEGSELEALRSHDFAAVPVHVISVENSRGDNKIDLFLRRHGFRLTLTIGKEEEIYRNLGW